MMARIVVVPRDGSSGIPKNQLECVGVAHAIEIGTEVRV